MIGEPLIVRAPENVGVPEKVPDSAAPLMVGDVRVLFVYVSVPARVAIVPSKFGTVRVRVVPVVMPDASNFTFLVVSVVSTISALA